MTLLREFWVPILVLDIYSDTKDRFLHKCFCRNIGRAILKTCHKNYETLKNNVSLQSPCWNTFNPVVICKLSFMNGQGKGVLAFLIAYF